MTTFWILCALLALAAVGFVAPVLLRRASAVGDTRERVNVAIYRERLAELEADRRWEDEAERAAARDELLAELGRQTDVSPPDGEPSAAPSLEPLGQGHPMLAVGLAGLLPIAALVLYLWLGEPTLFLAPATAGQAPSNAVTADAPAPEAPPINEMIQGLEQRLASNPSDVQGWMLLARSLSQTGDLDGARHALERGLAATPGEPDLQVALAEALARLADNRFAGRPLRLLQATLQTHPDHRKALWLAGIGEFQAERPREALAWWGHLRSLGEFSPDDEALLERFISEAASQLPPEERAAVLGTAAPASRSDGGAKPTAVEAPDTGTAASHNPVAVGITARISLSPALAGDVEPNDTVFVLAQALEGPRVPLAVVRRLVADLPFEVHLDDSMAMVPAMTISAFPEVVIRARISKSGRATPAPGDLSGESKPLAVGQASPIAIEIDTRVP